MFKMTVTRFAANDGMNVKEFKAGEIYAKSELSPEIYEVYKLRGDLIEVKTEKNILNTVEELHEFKKKRGVK